ncbi:MAG: CheB methylesterase domain-containing protein [Acidobacteriota bacterium]
MKPVRVAVFDKAASIRALLKRTVGESENLICIGSHPISVFLEYDAALGSADSVVIGLDIAEAATWPALAAHLDGSPIPAVILSPIEDPGQAPTRWPEHCISLEKPTSPGGWKVLCSTLVSALESMNNGSARLSDPGRRTPVGLENGLDLIAVGGSAGGPEATGEMLKSVGEALQKTAVVIVQHISEGFESEYVQWLSRILTWTDVDIARDGELLSPGRVRLAGPGVHLEISEGPAIRFDRESPPNHGHRPSVDHLFQSIARVKPEGSAGVLLSGMGIDGVDGLASLNRVGCLTLVQDQATSAVFGMPGAAIKRGASTIARPPAALGIVLQHYIEAGGRR